MLEHVETGEGTRRINMSDIAASKRDLRFVWKICRFFLLIFLIAIISSLVINSLWEESFFSKLVFPVSLILSTYLSNNLFDKNGLRKIGLREFNHGSLREFVFGLVLALLTHLANFLPLVVFKAVALEEFNLGEKLIQIGVSGLLYWVLVGFGEEVAFRGYLLNCYPAGYRFWTRNIISALLFSALHLVNPSYTALISFLFAFIIGLYMGYLYKITGALWASIGFHISFNYFGSFFDLPEGLPFYMEMTTILAVLIINLALVKICYAGRRDQCSDSDRRGLLDLGCGA